MNDVSLAETTQIIPSTEKTPTLRTITALVRRGKTEGPLTPEASGEEIKLLIQMTNVAALRVPGAQKSSQTSEAEINSALIKDMVNWALAQADQKQPQEMIGAFKRKVLQYTLLVSIPYAVAKCLENVPGSSAYANYLIYELLRAAGQNPSLDRETEKQLIDFSKNWAINPEVREKYQKFVGATTAHRDAWIQGILGEVLVMRLAKQANLNPECASVNQDTNPPYIDCFITYKGKKIPVQVKSVQDPNILEMKFVKAAGSKGEPTDKLLITVGAPSILDPQNESYYLHALYPSEQKAQEFVGLLENALSQQNMSAQRSRYGKI